MPTHISAPPEENPPRSSAARILLVLFCLFFTAVFIGLGIWQVERRAWKLALIDRVEARVHAPAAPPPGPADWVGVTDERDEYRHVTFSGHFLNNRETQVYAATVYGAGYWVLTPLEEADGSIILVNRGFVPTEKRDPSTRQAGELEGEVTVTGLLRMTEPKGTLLRNNHPQDERWYSRDVAAIAAARGLDPARVAPYFVDADEKPNPPGGPIGGLTQISFHNSHLVYAITWFGMALMSAGAAVYALRRGRRER
jgi:surfeit locus 1 family protein